MTRERTWESMVFYGGPPQEAVSFGHETNGNENFIARGQHARPGGGVFRRPNARRPGKVALKSKTDLPSKSACRQGERRRVDAPRTLGVPSLHQHFGDARVD